MAEDDITRLLQNAEFEQILLDKQQVKDFIDQQKKKSTLNCTKCNLKILYKWLVQKEELRNIENIPLPELDAYLSQFYINLRKECGQEYEPGTFDSICASIERHLRDNEY
jgi:DNA-directed RNA polymerase subunit RPC12/RpoP